MDTRARAADDRRQLVMSDRHDPRSRAPWSRRGFLSTLSKTAVLGAGAAVLGPTLVPRAAEAGVGRGSSPAALVESRVVAVPHVAFGAVVAAIAEQDVTLTVDATLPIDAMRLGDTLVSVAGRLLLKGEGEARGRYLDDARNAPKLGAAVRDHLRTHWPELAEGVARRHRAWSHDFVRNVLRWSQALERSGLRGKRVRDPQGWIYLLEWAGAEVAADGSEPPPGLRDAPRQPAAASPEAYRDYVQALVAAVR